MRTSLHFRDGDEPRAVVSKTRDGHYISFHVAGADIYVPGDDSVAVVNARSWAAQLLNAAEQVVERLELETVAIQEAV
jgi:hypothetical protein